MKRDHPNWIERRLPIVCLVGIVASVLLAAVAMAVIGVVGFRARVGPAEEVVGGDESLGTVLGGVEIG